MAKFFTSWLVASIVVGLFVGRVIKAGSRSEQ